MSYQTDQSSLFIFNRHVPDVSPVHHARSEIDQVVRTDSEQIS